MRRHVVWVCCGCDDCEPLDGSEPSGYPCRDSPSSNGAEVVLAEGYDRLRAALEDIAGHFCPGDERRTYSSDIAGVMDRIRSTAREALTAATRSDT